MMNKAQLIETLEGREVQTPRGDGQYWTGYGHANLVQFTDAYLELLFAEI